MRSRIKKIILKFGHSLFKIIRIPIKWYWKICNIKTSGVRVMIIYKNSFILVRHWYNPLWVMPGGGIKKYETPEKAAIREIKEEIGLNIEQLDYKLGTYSNQKEGKNDTIHCFVVELDNQPDIKFKRLNLEISDIIWSSLDTFPSQTSKATIQRVIEYKNKDIELAIRPWSS